MTSHLLAGVARTDITPPLGIAHAGWGAQSHQRAAGVDLPLWATALALSDGKWIPRETMTELAERPTADFHYIRWMGPNRDITDYSHLQFDRSEEIRGWSDVLKRAALTTDVYGFFNNHFAGHSPANAREMQELLGERPVDPATLGDQISLF
jgi:uncharacterized protein YecE (DUF72 family)